MAKKQNSAGVKPLRKVCSIILALVSVFSLIAAGLGIKDTLAIKDYMEQTDTAAIIKQLNTLNDGIGQLAANEDAYFSGAVDYDNGVKDYQKGQGDLANGAAQLASGKKDLIKGEKDYADGKKQLADGKKQIEAGEKDLAAGKKQVADGQKELDANTAAYNEGKEQLAQIEPLMPYVDQYVQFRDGNLKALPGFDNAQEWFASVVRPVAKNAGLDIPDNVNDLPKYVQDMVKDGKAQLKEYEDGQKTLEAGKKEVADGEKQLAEAKQQYADGQKDLAAGKAQLDAGYADYAKGQRDYADGKKQLAEGAQQLKEGKASLTEFEDGVAQIKDGLKEVSASMPAVTAKKGDVRVKSLAQRFGGSLDVTKLGDDGKPVMLHNGETYIDLAKAGQIGKESLKYVQDSSDDATAELTNKVILYGILAIAALLGLIAGILGIWGKGNVLATITAVLSAAGLIFGIKNHFMDYAYTMADGTYKGTLQAVALIVLTVVAILAAIYYWPTRVKRAKKDKKSKDQPKDKPVAKA